MNPNAIANTPSLDRRQLLGVAAAAALQSVAPAAWAKPDPLLVGGLPVTCNLTLPVACVAKATANSADKSGAPKFRSKGDPRALEYMKPESIKKSKDNIGTRILLNSNAT